MAAELPLHDRFLSCLAAIKAAKRAFPNKNVTLLGILEDSIRLFQDIPEYRNYRRYLHLWIEYADCSHDPAKVFEEMIERQIGQKHSIFYSAYAVVLEGAQRFRDAEAVYKLGISMGAHPLERLQNDYKLFQQRMALREKRKREKQKPAGILSSDKSIDNLSVQADNSSKPERGNTTLPSNGLRTATIVKPVVPTTVPTASGVCGEATVEIRSFAVRAIAAKDAGVEDILHHGLLEPTINTKEALNGILPMFSEPLQNVRKKKKSTRRPKEFVVFQDEDLPSSAGLQTSSKEFVVFKDENSASPPVSSEDFVVFQDENSALPTVSSDQCVVFQDENLKPPTAGSKEFVIFQDENLPPPVRSKGSSQEFIVFQDEDL